MSPAAAGIATRLWTIEHVLRLMDADGLRSAKREFKLCRYCHSQWAAETAPWITPTPDLGRGWNSRFHPAFYCDITQIMRKETLISQKRRGPAPTGKGLPILVRVQPASVVALDNWIARQDDNPSRPEAIRRLVEQALTATPLPVVEFRHTKSDMIADEPNPVAQPAKPARRSK